MLDPPQPVLSVANPGGNKSVCRLVYMMDVRDEAHIMGFTRVNRQNQVIVNLPDMGLQEWRGDEALDMKDSGT